MPAGLQLPKRLSLSRVRAGTHYLRIHARQRSALWFGPSAGHLPINRFDDPAGRFRTCYLGTTIDVCFAETFLRNPPVRILAIEDLAARSVATIEVVGELRLAALHCQLRALASMVACALRTSRHPRRANISVKSRRFGLVRRHLYRAKTVWQSSTTAVLLKTKSF